MLLENIVTRWLLIFPAFCLVHGYADWHFSGINVALHKNSTQNPGIYKRQGAGLAVDGNTNSDTTLLHCSHTDLAIDPKYAWWSVDLGSFYFLTGIQIYNRKDYYTRKRLEGFTITGRSTEGNKEIYSSTNGEYNDSIINVDLNGEIAFNNITISLPRHSSDSYLTLCEVKVFAKGCRGITTDSSFSATMLSGHTISNDSFLYNGIGTTIQIRCSPGYTPQAPFNVQCQPDTHYNVSDPFCQHVQYCHLPQLHDGQYTVTPGSFFDNTNLHVRVHGMVWAVCNPGFGGHRRQFITCQPNGVWSGKIPTCQEIYCRHPGSIQDGYYTSINNTRIYSFPTYQFAFNTSVNAKCETGFTMSSDSSNVIKCTFNGNWSSQPSCVRQPCDVPTLTYGYYRHMNSTITPIVPLSVIYYGDDIQPVCINSSYRLQTRGNSYQTCEANGRLSGGKSTCVPLCNFPDIPNGVYYDTTGNNNGTIQEGGQLIPMCHQGYKLIGRGGARICQQDHTWSGKTATCTAKTCRTDQYNFENEGTMFADNITIVKFNESIQLRCSVGYKIESGDISLRCNENNTLRGNPLKCAIKTCIVDLLSLEGYNVTGKSKPVDFNDTLQLECKPGFRSVRGLHTLRCSDNEQFEGDPLKCEVKTCIVDLLSLEGYNVTGKSKPVDFNDTLQLECKPGFRSVRGLHTLRCSDNEQFEGDPLKCEAMLQPESESRTSPIVIGGIGGSCAGLILVTAIIVLLLYKRRRHGLPERKDKKEQRFELSETNGRNRYAYANTIDTNQLDIEDHVYNIPADINIYNTIVEKEEEQEDSSHDYYSFTVEKLPTSAIRVRDLAETILIGDNDKFQRQFQSFPKGMQGLHEAAVKTENRGKNKYREMYPYDMTRVALQPGNLMSETDYINASYINGFSMSKRYIAAQAPFDPSLNDFWRMIWQMNVSKIVMLTNLKEEGKVKCVQYWPNENSSMYGRVKVTLTKAEEFSDFVIRHFLISKDDASNRTVIQFHFTAWPDKGVPKYACSLVHFRHKAMSTETNTKGPVVVHCSAGVGRTGTFIALDILVEQGKRLQYVDVLGCVQTLRKQRVLMVQTQEQYKFIHLALTETLMLSPSVLPAAKFIDYYETALEINPEAGKTYVNTEFAMLKSMSPIAEESQYISAKDVQNRKKNRYPNILPVEEFMPRLKDESANSYINAVFLPSYRAKDAFLITQAPMESTKEEFWRLVYDHKVHTIVMMNNVCELDSDNEIYWPQDEGVVTFDKLTVSLIETEEEGGHYIMTLELAVSDKKRQIKLFQYCYQMTDTFPGTPESVLTMMELVQYWQQHTGNHPIVVHCMNGVEKSGLYCVISAVIERLKIEQDVAISQTIEVMRNCREQLVSSVEQFEFCHEAVSVYIKQFETYSNFSEVNI